MNYQCGMRVKIPKQEKEQFFCPSGPFKPIGEFKEHPMSKTNLSINLPSELFKKRDLLFSLFDVLQNNFGLTEMENMKPYLHRYYR